MRRWKGPPTSSLACACESTHISPRRSFAFRSGSVRHRCSSAAVAPHSSSLSAPSWAASKKRTHLHEARLARVSGKAAWDPAWGSTVPAWRTLHRPQARRPPLAGVRAALTCRWRTRRAQRPSLGLCPGRTALRSHPSLAARRSRACSRLCDPDVDCATSRRAQLAKFKGSESVWTCRVAQRRTTRLMNFFYTRAQCDHWNSILPLNSAVAFICPKVAFISSLISSHSRMIYNSFSVRRPVAGNRD